MFAIIYDTQTKKIKRVQAGVDSEADVTLNNGEAVKLLEKPPKTIPQHAYLDENFNIVDGVQPIRLSPETLLKMQAEQRIQMHLDNVAHQHGYDNILSACSYAAYDNPYQQEGQRFVKWRGLVWQTAYQIMLDAQQGNRPMPSIDDIINELPKFEETQI